ncbi:hypothetical protein [Kytococcus sedentarius]|uniref:hypothetical protein n=1 Tax=Kytococcus sedentarius TaxID=1276 RepID=UPI0035BC5BAA
MTPDSALPDSALPHSGSLGSCLAPWPDPVPVGDHPRRSTEADVLRAAVWPLVDGVDWALLTWPELLAALGRRGATDIAWSRLAEGHVDAVRILSQAGRRAAPDCLYGVWASRSRGTGPRAEPVDGGWRVHGTLRFASGVGVLDRALVTGVDPDGTHRLFELDVSTLVGDPSSWAATGMAPSRSWTVEVDRGASSDAEVGEPGWYLHRPAFLPGGVGVAAVWWGATVRAVREVQRAGQGAPAAPDRAVRWGHVRTELAAAGAALQVAGLRLEELLPTAQVRDWDTLGPVVGQEVAAVSGEVRAVVATAAGRVLEHLRVLAGAAGLALDAGVAHAVEDLTVYLAQHPVDRAAGGLGDPG